MSEAEQLSAIFGHTFSRPERLERALTHSSWIAENSGIRGDAQAQQASENSGGEASPEMTTWISACVFIGCCAELNVPVTGWTTTV